MSDARTFYKEELGAAVSGDYEASRWGTSPFRAAQYEMTKNAIMQHALPAFASARSIIEVGPGPGTWTKLFLKQNPESRYTLVDLSKDMLAMAKAALPKTAQIDYAESDFLEFTTDNKYDGFFSSRAIEYFDYKIAAKKIGGLLAPGARGVIITKTPKPFFDRLQGRKSQMHGGQVSPNKLAAALRSAGLRVLKTRIATATVPGLHSVFLNKLMFGFLNAVPLPLLSLFSESYLIVFEKSS